MRSLLEKSVPAALVAALDAAITREGMERHIRYLCDTIGVRMPGTAEERAAAAYCAEVARDLGYEVEIEEVSYMAWAADATRVDMVEPDARPLAATWFSYTLPTPQEGIVAGVAYVGMEGEEDWSEARGRLPSWPGALPPARVAAN